MVKTFIVLYTILTYVEGSGYEQAISHGLQFNDYEECSLFFKNNKTNLMAGAIDYGERRYGHPMEINEIGCVTMNVNMIEQDPDEYQKLKDFRTLWSNE